jgi:hypothetical protein
LRERGREDSLSERVIAAAEQCQLFNFAGAHLGLDGGKDSGQNPVDLFMSRDFATYVIRELLKTRANRTRAGKDRPCHCLVAESKILI